MEFETDLTGGRTLDMPPEIAEVLPRRGRATVVVLVDLDSDDKAWRQAAYRQFLRDSSSEDAVCDKYS